jgi:hypothetical protein
MDNASEGKQMKSFKGFISEVAEPTGDLKKACWKGYTAVGMKMKNGRKVPNCVPVKEAANAAQQAAIAIAMKKAGKKPKNEEVEQLDERGANKYKRSTESGAGLTRAGVMKHRREHPGSKLSTAVTTEPSKLKHGSKAWNRRKSFCARMSGMKGPMKDEKGRPTRKAMSLRRWHCEE